MWLWHDDWLLWLIQEGLYAHTWLTSLGLLSLVAALPRHHARVWLFVMGPVNLVCLLSLVLYGAWTAVPGLAWVMLGVLLYQVARWVSWRARGPGAKARTPWLLRAGAWPMQRLVAAYVQLDPRAVYWIDLARAERGLALQRTTAERRAVVEVRSKRIWSRWFWRGWLWLTERRILLFSWLCRPRSTESSTLWSRCRGAIARFYRVPQPGLALAEPHLLSELESAVDRAAKDTLLLWAGRNFTEYRHRKERDQQLATQRAAARGRQWMLHREALAEIQTLREPWSSDETGLETTARFVYATWQLRRQFDFLWFPESDQLGVEVDELSGHSAPSASDTEIGNQRLKAYETAGLDTIEEISSKTDAFEAVAESADSSDAEESEDSEFAVLRQAVRGAHHGVGDESDLGGRGGGVATATISDRDLFAAADEFDEPDEPERPDQPPASAMPSHLTEFAASEWAPRDRALLRDLTQGIRLLRAFLGLPEAVAADEQARLMVIFRKQPERRAAVLQLVTLHTLAEKYRKSVRPNSERTQRDPLAKWLELVRETANKARNRASSRTRDGKPLPEELLAWEFFGNFHLDVLYERHAFLDIREFLVPLPNLSPYQYKLLGDAEAQLSIRLAGQPGLQTMLRLDAIGHYFQASFPGLWTFEVARFLVDDVANRQSLLAKFEANPLSVDGGGTLGVQDAQAPTRREQAPAVEIVQVLGAQRRLRVDVMVRIGKTVKTAAIVTPFHIGPAAHCNWKLSADLPSLSLVCREGRLWLETEKPSSLLSVNGKNKIKSAQLNPGDVIQVGQSAIQIQSVSLS